MFSATFTSDRARPRVAVASLAVAVLAALLVLLGGTADAASQVGKFNFQPAGAPTPDGFTAETGQPFSHARGYGWTKHNGDGTPVDVSQSAHRRSIAGDPRLDTSIEMTERNTQWGRWEMAVPNGRYRLWITVGDVADPNTRQRLAIEGEDLIDWTSTPDNRTQSFRREVTVTDGRLTYFAIGGARTALVATTVIALETADAPADAHDEPATPETTTTTAAPTTTASSGTTATRTQPVAGDTIGAIAGFAPGGHFPAMSMDKINKQLDHMAASGATWLRMPFTWTSFESTKGRFTFRKHTQIVEAANARGIRIVANLSYTPKWARSAACAGSMFCEPANVADYANYVNETVAHFLPLGVQHYELWNEPNMAIFWAPKPDIAKYSALVKATYRKVKPNHPKAVIMAGSLAPARDLKNGNQIKGTTFLEGMYRNGVKGHFDAFSYHPYNYPAAPEVVADWHSFGGVVPALQDIMRAHGDGDKTDIWGTEYAYHTATSGGGVSEATQAEYVGRSYAAWTKISKAPLIWFSMTDRGTNTHDREHMFGILRADYSPKPAWNAFKQTMRQKR